MSEPGLYPSDLLAARIAAGELRADAGQAEIALALDQIVDVAAGLGRRSWMKTLISKTETPRGLYIYGGVGRGKTMLMDMFYAALPTGPNSPTKWRLHFHDFMVQAQDMIHDARAAGDSDPIETAAAALAKKGRIMCFDEMEVRDIADAMILSRLFSNIMNRGVVVVATSNRHADDLYKDGLHRDRFLPFIDLLKARCDMRPIADGQDWRGAILAQVPAWYSPVDAAGSAALEAAFTQLRGNVPEQSETIKVAGRDIVIARAAADIAFVNFADLCDVPLAARDYLAVAGRFAGLVMADIPRFDQNNENAARRFMWLIDALYDRGRFFIASSSCPIDDLYHGRHFEFEFTRTQSRLGEMARRDHADGR